MNHGERRSIGISFVLAIAMACSSSGDDAASHDGGAEGSGFADAAAGASGAAGGAPADAAPKPSGGLGGATGGTTGAGGTTCPGNAPASGSCSCTGSGSGGTGRPSCGFSYGDTIGTCECVGNCAVGGTGAIPLSAYPQWCCHAACPETEPPQGSDFYASTCGAGGGGAGSTVCAYGSRYCGCTAAGTWNCGLAQCPTLPPSEGADCAAYQEDLLCDDNSSSQRCTCDAATDTWECLTCPATTPQIGGNCAGHPPVCSYGDGTCYCGQNNLWSCDLTCPPTQPLEGTSCQIGGRSCAYASEACTCDSSTERWHCGTCPTRPPPEGADCSSVGQIGCSYSTGSCACTAPPTSQWSCSLWCPATKPLGSCPDVSADMGCRYGGEMCRCNTALDSWQCSFCPLLPPVNGTDCTGYPDVCGYANGSCTCAGPGWTWSCN